MAEEIGIGLIGTGFMGKCHALAFGAVAATTDPTLRPRLELLCDTDGDHAAAMARQFGFSRATTDWRELVTDPAVDIVSITAPNALHHDMAVTAAQAGKHVYCEKPMALTVANASAMADAVAEAGVKSLVGYNYLRNPAIAYARQMIGDGELGDVFSFRGIFDEDFMANAATPFSWRCRGADSGAGALGDMATHLVSLAHYLAGPIEAVCASTQTVITERPAAGPDQPGGTVENDDLADALVRFASGATGVLSTSRINWGRKCHLAYEINGTDGTLIFDQERMNELQHYRPPPGESADPLRPATADEGFRTILMGPAHPGYDNFVPASGAGLGFNDLKVLEVSHLLAGIAGEETLYPDFQEALSIERVIDAIVRSAAASSWVEIDS